MAPLTMWDEKNTGTNLPAQIELYADTATRPRDGTYKFLFMAKGGGSGQQELPVPGDQGVLNPTSLMRFLDEKLRALGTAACPPYHLAIVIGGTSAEFALKTAKYASAKYLDTLPTEGRWRATASATRARGEVLELTRSSASAPSSAASTSATTCG
jgi:fumarate hydratase class I